MAEPIRNPNQNQNQNQNQPVTFETFYNQWLVRNQQFLDQLVASLRPENLSNERLHVSLTDQVISHLQLYYRNLPLDTYPMVFETVVEPPWLTVSEWCEHWMGGYNPTLIFNVVNRAVTDLSIQQLKAVQSIKRKSRNRMDEIQTEVDLIQDMIVSRPLRILVSRVREEVLDLLKWAMLRLLNNAEDLRRYDWQQISELLNPQ